MASKNVVLADPVAVAETVAKATVDVLAAALQTQETVTWLMTGGTLPPSIFKILARDYRDALDWSKVIFGVDDERCVPLDSPDLNWILAEQNLFSALGDVVPAEHKLCPAADQGAETAAAAYAHTLDELPKNDVGLPQFDLAWIGFGDDGHTLSLFPGHPSSVPSDEMVIPVHDSPKPPADRISLTVKAMKGTKNLFVIGAGGSKAPVIARVQNGDASLPLQQVTAAVAAADGQVTWFLDAAAAEQLPA